MSQRHLAAVALALTATAAAAVLLPGLGAAGLWDPWEMRAAHVARRMVEPARILVVEPPAPGGDVTWPLARAVHEALGDAVGVTPPELAAGSRTLAARKFARKSVLRWARRQLDGSVYHGVVVDLSMWFGDAPDTKTATEAAKALAEWSARNGGTRFALAWRGGAAEAVAALRRVELAAGGTTGETRRLDDWLDLDRATFGGPDDAAGLRRALDGIEGAPWWRAQFKRDGITRSIPPLGPWLMAWSWTALGFDEASTRLPFALFGMLTALALCALAGGLLGWRTGAIAAIVLLTMPEFAALARYAAGRMPFIFFLTLGAGGLLRLAAGGGARWFVAVALGALGSFLADGLFGMLALTVTAAAAALVVPQRPRKLLAAASGLVLAQLAASALVLAPSRWTFWWHFRYMHQLFTAGPPDTSRSFDWFIRQLGFGMLPWAPLAAIALGGLLAGLVRREADASHWPGARGKAPTAVLLLWFAAPLLLYMAGVHDFSHFQYPALPAAALGVALLVDRLIERDRVLDGLSAFFLFFMLIFMAAELGRFRDSLFLALTVDPPFLKTKGAALHFPEAFHTPRVYVLLGVAAAFAATWPIVRGGRALRRAVAWAARPATWWTMALFVAALLPVWWAASTGQAMFDAVRTAPRGALGPVDRWYPAAVFRRPEAALLAAAAILFGIQALVEGGPLAGLAARLPRAVRAVLGAVVRIWRMARLDRPAVAAAAAALLAAGSLVSALVTLSAPRHFGVGTLWLDPVWWGLVAASLGTILWAYRAKGRSAALLAAGWAVAACCAYAGTRISKELWVYDRPFSGLLGAAALVAWTALARALRGRPRWAAALAVLFAWLWSALAFQTLLARWPVLAAKALPNGGDTALRTAFAGSLVTRLLYVWAGVVVAIRVGRARWATGLRRLASAAAERSDDLRYAAVALGAIAVAGVLVYEHVVFATMSFHVSQKHIVETYRAARDDGAPRPDLFRHGSFVGGGEDYNFYTRNVPEVAVRRDALAVLARRRDVAVVLRGGGFRPPHNVAVVQGWNPRNDRNGDGKRDWRTYAGIAEESAAGTLRDDDAHWKPDEWKGFVLVEPNGRTVPIEGNDEHTLRLAGTPHLGRPGSALAAFAIDHPDAPDHRATAMAPWRSFFMLPRKQFSELNYWYRKQTGHPIALLDERSSSIVLATSRLRPGEEDHNWLAEHTLTPEQFAARRGVQPTSVVFDDRLELVGWKVEPLHASRRGKFKLMTYWKVIGDPPPNYKMFVHIDRAGATNRIHADHYVFNLSDDPNEEACIGCYQTNHWLRGDIIEDVYERDVPIGIPSGPYEIWLGWYERGSGKRLPVVRFDRTRVVHDGHNRVKIGVMFVQ